MIRLVTLLLATLALVAAALDLRVGRPRLPRVAVLIDESPSTRGMTFRDADGAMNAARRLAPKANLTLETFADTALPTLDADAILLFSDGQLDAATPTTPIFPIVDDRDVVEDARLTDAWIDGDRLLATVTNDGPPRMLRWPDGRTQRVDAGTFTLAHAAMPGTIALDAGDRWPENNTIAVTVAPAPIERWWIGDAAPDGFRAIDAGVLPPLDAWLAARVVVLNNVPADAFDEAGRETIARYARDLGGAVVMLGGNHAFSAGGYATTPLDAISPLASTPPTATHEWFVLVDASGSMAARIADGRSKLDAALDAAVALETALPVSATVAAGDVARDVNWWPATGASRIVPPEAIIARGETNLERAIDAVAMRRASATLPARLLLLTDGEATFTDLAGTIARCQAARLSVDWIALPPASSDGPLARLVAATKGVRREAGQPIDWPRIARETARAAQGTPLRKGPIGVVSASLGTATIDAANVVYPRVEIETLAVEEADNQTLAATWRVGLGRVTAVAFAPPPAWRAAWLDRFQASPRDPRFTTTWTRDGVTVEVDDAYLDVRPTLRLVEIAAGPDGMTTPFARVGPGRYRAPLARSPRPLLATIVSGDGTMIDAAAVPGGAAREFDQIGIDRARLASLASRTGGRVIDAREATPIAELPRPIVPRSARVPLLLAAITLLAASVVTRR